MRKFEILLLQFDLILSSGAQSQDGAQTPPSIIHHNSKHTYNPSVKVRVGRHLEAGVRHQEAGDVGEAGVDVFAYVLQLLVLVLRDLRVEQTRDHYNAFARFKVRRSWMTHLQPLLQELDASLLSVGELVGKAPVPDEENHGLLEKKLQCNSTSWKLIMN